MIRLALRLPYWVAVLALAIGVLGLTVTVRLPADILPLFKTPAVQILTLYPGMPTDIVERDITNRLERWTSQANGISRQESRSLIGVSIVKDFFRPDIDPNTALSQVSSLAISDMYYLPPGTVPPMVMPFDPTASLPLCLLAVSSKTLDETALYDVAYFQMRNLLSGTPGVIAPAVYGGRLRRVLIYVDRERLMARGMSLTDVITAVRNQNVLIPSGDANIGDFDYQVDSNAMVSEVAEFNDIPLKFVDGRPILLRDIGEASDSYAIQTNVVRINGKRAVYIPIYRQPGANTIEVVEGIKRALPGIKQRVSNGEQIDLEVIVDQSVVVRQAITSLVWEGILGAALAAFMVWLFLGSLRAIAIVVLSLPLAVLTTMIGLYFTGQTINAMTLGGLALAIGMLLDNGIVVLENIMRHLAAGKSPVLAARDGAEEVAGPVLVATVTLCVVFIPVMFLTGIGKFLFAPLSLVVVISVLASYGLSMTLIPALSSRLLRPPSAETAFERAFRRFQLLYQVSLEWAMRRRPLVLLLIAGGFALSCALYPHLGQELFPQLDSGQITVLLRAPTGTRMEKTEHYADLAEKAIRQTIPAAHVKMVVANIGVLYDWPAAYTPNAGPHEAFLLVQLQGRNRLSTQEYAQQLRRVLPTQVVGASFAVDTGGLVSSALNFGLPSPIDIQVEGASLEVANQIAHTIRAHVASLRGAVDVRVQQVLDYPQIRVDVDRLRAASVGLTQDDVVKNIVSALASSVSFLPAFWIDHKSGNHYFVGVTYREKDIRSLETIADIPVTGAQQSRAVPVRNLAKLEFARAPAEVNHVNIRRVTDIYANVAGRDVGSVARDVEGILDRVRPGLPKGYSVSLRGEVSSMKESFASLGLGSMLAVILVYLALVGLFQSFVDPLIILMAVPVGLAGVFLMLFFSGTTLNIQSLLGIIMTVGLAVAYSVLVVDFANQLVAQGRPLRQAAVEASVLRLRPILMTSVAAILGLVPMAVRAGEANMPLARAVIGGLTVSTLVKLYLVPILYTYLRKERKPE